MIIVPTYAGGRSDTEHVDCKAIDVWRISRFESRWGKLYMTSSDFDLENPTQSIEHQPTLSMQNYE